MQWRVLHEQDGQRTLAIIFETGDEVITTLQALAREQKLGGSQFTAIGAFEKSVIAFFDIDTRQYARIPVDEQTEVLTLAGDISLEHDEPRVHAHVVLGRRDGSTRGGHLLEARVRPTLEVILTESGARMTRRYDAQSGLSLIRFDEHANAGAASGSGS